MERRPMTTTFAAYKRTVLAVVFLLAVLVAAVPPSLVLAQAPPGTVQAPPATRTETRDVDDSGKWGLLGLLGLVGLAGLLRRDKARSVTVTDRPDRR
jgi:MYXO-CTERM domain-containing protein